MHVEYSLVLRRAGESLTSLHERAEERKKQGKRMNRHPHGAREKVWIEHLSVKG